MSNWIWFGLIVLAFVVANLAYPHVLTYALRNHVVDNPNERKLQRVPVPVMGGVVVWIGVLITLIITFILTKDIYVLWNLVLLTIMFGIGVWDDMRNISAWLRFLVEIMVVWMMILVLKIEINDLHGLWGIHEIPDTVSMPLSLIAGVGIINAVNLIDGVDGYCSSYGIIACIGFAIAFYVGGVWELSVLALVFAAALVPFFFHNVFGRKSKMFLGDGGSLMLGTLLASFVFAMLTSGGPCEQLDADGLSPVAFSLAVLAVPVFDTLRVMTSRILRGLSPFHPDKTHLHHLFIDLNFSHLATSYVIIGGNLFVVFCLLVAWKLGLPVDGQVYLVLALGLWNTTGFYYWMRRQEPKSVQDDGTALYQRVYRLGAKSHFSLSPFWTFLRDLMDNRFFGGREINREVPPVPADAVRPDPRIR